VVLDGADIAPRVGGEGVLTGGEQVSGGKVVVSASFGDEVRAFVSQALNLT